MEITAYCMKTKEKNVKMLNAVITVTAKGGCMAQGVDANGNKMTTMFIDAQSNIIYSFDVQKQYYFKVYLA